MRLLSVLGVLAGGVLVLQYVVEHAEEVIESVSVHMTPKRGMYLGCIMLLFSLLYIFN